MKRPRPIPDDVQALAAEFARWRKERPHARAHLPDTLLQKAVAAAHLHTVGIVARSVKFDRRRLRAAVSQDGGRRRSGGAPSTAGQASLRLVPVKLAPTPAASGAVVEIEDPSGWRLRLTCSDGSAALKAFVEARR